ncbi:MAG: hypothetical protein MJ204_02650 [Bacteroidales bacterium]|nr:hypothetical protein [Bacteroidales bacterium]MCQ2605427.1 hypothetical protein [Bacteroidales bacterium]
MGVKSIQSPQFLQALGADLIIDDNNGTMYVCTMDSSIADRSANAIPFEQQSIWQIKRVQETAENGLTKTTIMFPNGRNAFAFVAADFETYSYNYSK